MPDVYLRLIDARAYHLRWIDHNWNVARTLTRAVQQPLVVDTRPIVEVVMEEIGDFLESPP